MNNNFIELVLPHLDDYYILVDSKRPVGWEDTYELEKNNLLHFHFHNPRKTEEILEKCDEIHFIHGVIIRELIFGSGKKSGEQSLYKLST